MSRDVAAVGEPLADLPAEVALSAPTLLARGFRDYQRFEVAVATDAGQSRQVRDVLRVGKVAAVLPVDPVRDKIVLMRQFRLPAHLANGRGALIEIVAGHVEAGETPAETARRECIEEIAAEPARLIELFTYLTTPGLCDEEITVFLGVVDSSRVPAQAGRAADGELTRPVVIAIDIALAALERGMMHNGPLVIALQWLALHRARLAEIARTGAVGL